MSELDTELADFEDEDPVFDPKQSYAKNRGLGEPVTYIQNDHVFSASYKFVREVEKAFTPAMEVKEKKSKKKKAREPKLSAVETAANKLKAFREPDAPDGIQLARKENAKAKLAERFAE